MPDKKKIYPTTPDKEGFYYASPEEEEQQIKTRHYENGADVKVLALSNKREVIVRKLRGRDFVETKRRIQNDNSLDFETANMATATTIDGKQQPPEYYLDDLFQNDYAKIMIAYGALNFQ